MMLVALIALVTVHLSCTRAEEVCYPVVGCFNNVPPFNNTGGLLPASPEDQEFMTLLFTRSDPDGVPVYFDDPSSIPPTSFDASKKIKFFVHGFGDSINSTWMHMSKDLLLQQKNLNIFLVGWAKGALPPNYPQAATNLRVVGKAIAVLVEELLTLGADPADVHLIGFSLGGQTVGQAGMQTGGKLGRITGLDPAGPLFEDTDPLVGLDETDAVFVDVTHTNGAPLDVLFNGGYGTMQRLGHVDYYVNGGQIQPGCLDGLLSILGSVVNNNGKRESAVSLSAADEHVCSHLRAVFLWVESLSSDCPFVAVACDSLDEFNQGLCKGCRGNSCNKMGIDAKPNKALGALYIDTHSVFPFCIDRCDSDDD